MHPDLAVPLTLRPLWDAECLFAASGGIRVTICPDLLPVDLLWGIFVPKKAPKGVRGGTRLGSGLCSRVSPLLALHFTTGSGPMVRVLHMTPTIAASFTDLPKLRKYTARIRALAYSGGIWRHLAASGSAVFSVG